MNFTIWRIGFGTNGQKWARGGTIYKNTYYVPSGKIGSDCQWTYLGFKLWWRVNGCKNRNRTRTKNS